MKTNYHSFLLRLWTQNHHDDENVWRASLQCPQSGQTISFSSIAELNDYLDTLTSVQQAEKQHNKNVDT